MQTVSSLATTLGSRLDTLTAPVRDTAAELIVGQGGIGLLALGGLGLLVLCADATRLVVHVGRRSRRGRSGAAKARRAVQARALAGAGAAVSEIVQRTGLSRDALALVTGSAPPVAQRSAGGVADATGAAIGVPSGGQVTARVRRAGPPASSPHAAVPTLHMAGGRRSSRIGVTA